MVGTQLPDVPHDARNDESGQFTRKYADEDFLDAVDRLGPLAATADVAEAVGCSHIRANERLNDLREDGRITAEKRAGANLWSLTDDEDQ